jgi:Ca-activated chloride channel homolog
MDLMWPEFRWLLILVPFLFGMYLWSQHRRQRYALRYSSLLIIQDASPAIHPRRRHVPPLLSLAALAAMLIALCRPQTVVGLPQTYETVVLAIDISSSMLSDDIYPNRLEAAKDAARRFVLGKKPSTSVGLVAFSGTATIVQVPTTDKSTLTSAINHLTPGWSTAIGSGIVVSLNAIFGNIFADTLGTDITPASLGPTPPSGKATRTPSTVILLTDGANVEGPSPLAAAQKAADLGVRVFTIGVGDPSQRANQSRSRNVRFEVDEAMLKKVADMTGGEYFLAGDANALQEIYQGLGSHLVVTPQRMELTALFTGVAALFSVLAGALSIHWFNRLP